MIELLFLLSAFVSEIVGSFVGKKLVDKIQQKTFRQLVLCAIALISLKFVYEGVLFLL